MLNKCRVIKWLISEEANIWVHGAVALAMLFTSVLHHSSTYLTSLSEAQFPNLWKGKDSDMD